MSHPLKISQDGPILELTLNRPDKLNAFSAELVEALQCTLDQAEAQSIRLVVFKGAGKGFSGGFDLDGLDSMNDDDLLHRFVQVEKLLQSVYHAPFATLGLVHGPCYGAAADLVLACRYRVASKEARFRMPGLGFGIVLGSRRLAEVVGSGNARQLLIRAKPFDSEEALALGFIDQIADQNNWQAIVERQIDGLASFEPESYAAMVAAMTEDYREKDMATLVSSVKQGSIKKRLQDYIAKLQAARNK